MTRLLRRLFFPSACAALACAACSWGAFAAKAPAVEMVVDEPTPANLQAMVTAHHVALTWDWRSPDEQPAFERRGFEVRRQDGKLVFVQVLKYDDFDLAPGSYSYQVRVRADARFKKHSVIHLSDWSAPVEAVIQTACTAAPQVRLLVQPTRPTYASVASLRIRLWGDIQVPEGCAIVHPSYHVDAGTGAPRSGALHPDPHGHFDEFIEALDPDEELPSGPATFDITASAEDEAGTATSSAYSLTIELQNPYAPRLPGE